MYGGITVPDGSGKGGELTVEDIGYFALPAFFITFREFLEAAIIIAVLLGILSKMNQNHMRKYVWLGALSAAVICILLGVVFIVLINVLKEKILTPHSTNLIEGIIAIIAAVLIAVVASTIGNVMAINSKYEQRLADAIERDGETGLTSKSIFFLSFSTVMREGIETIIFFTGIGSAYPAASLPIPAITGALVGSIIGVLLYKAGNKMTINIFFKFTMVLLVFVGAGVFSNGISALQAANVFGEYEDVSKRGPMNKPVWSIENCCGFDKSEFWVMLRVLFGYTPNPSGLEILMYLLYHLFVWSALVIKYKFRKRKDEGKPALFKCGSKVCGGVDQDDVIHPVSGSSDLLRENDAEQTL